MKNFLIVLSWLFFLQLSFNASGQIISGSSNSNQPRTGYVMDTSFTQVIHFTSTDLVKWVEHQPAVVGLVSKHFLHYFGNKP